MAASIAQVKDFYRIMICGDSISKGIIYDPVKKKYIKAKNSFQELLKNKIKGVICNTARFGNTIVRAGKRFFKDIESNEPDIVLIELGGNDCDYNWEEIAKNPYLEHKPNTDYRVFEKELTHMVNELNSKEITPVLMTLPPIDPDRYFNWISKNDEQNKKSILKWLGSKSRIYWWQERYNSVVLKVASETNTRLIDVRSEFLFTDDYRNYIGLDGIHPTEEGYKLIANKVLKYINKNYSFLCKRSSS